MCSEKVFIKSTVIYLHGLKGELNHENAHVEELKVVKTKVSMKAHEQINKLNTLLEKAKFLNCLPDQTNFTNLQMFTIVRKCK
jgi:hypothetical protein